MARPGVQPGRRIQPDLGTAGNRHQGRLGASASGALHAACQAGAALPFPAPSDQGVSRFRRACRSGGTRCCAPARPRAAPAPRRCTARRRAGSAGGSGSRRVEPARGQHRVPHGPARAVPQSRTRAGRQRGPQPPPSALLRQWRTAGWIKPSVRDHAATVEALRARDQEALRRAVAGHLRQARRLGGEGGLRGPAGRLDRAPGCSAS